MSYLLNTLSFIKNNLLQFALIGLMGWMIHDLREDNKELKASLEAIKSFQASSFENAKPVQAAALKVPKATRQMEKIAEKKPAMLEKRMNLGFKQLTGDIEETTK